VISIGYLNGLFVLARSIGLIGHALDQKRLQARTCGRGPRAGQGGRGVLVQASVDGRRRQGLATWVTIGRAASHTARASRQLQRRSLHGALHVWGLYTLPALPLNLPRPPLTCLRTGAPVPPPLGGRPVSLARGALVRGPAASHAQQRGGPMQSCLCHSQTCCYPRFCLPEGEHPYQRHLMGYSPRARIAPPPHRYTT
jgi:hypothetical protein